MGGMRSGVAGTPTFFINGKRYEGALDHASLLSAIGRA
jgi:protein-disulfide isomerase